MKYFKTLGLVTLVAAALAAVGGISTASATILESSGGNLSQGTQIEMTGTNFVLKAGFATIECGHSELDGKTSNAGGAGESVEMQVNNLSFTECNGSVKVTKKGKLIYEHTSGSNLTVTSEGLEIDVTVGATTCTFGASTPRDLGTINGGWSALWNLLGSLTRISGSFLCANPAGWSVTYTVTSPNPFYGTAS